MIITDLKKLDDKKKALEIAKLWNTGSLIKFPVTEYCNIRHIEIPNSKYYRKIVIFCLDKLPDCRNCDKANGVCHCRGKEFEPHADTYIIPSDMAVISEL